MAGDDGLEPPNVGIKIRCLTNLANPQYKLGGEGQDRTDDLRVMNPALSPAELHHLYVVRVAGFEPAMCYTR